MPFDLDSSTAKPATDEPKERAQKSVCKGFLWPFHAAVPPFCRTYPLIPTRTRFVAGNRVSKFQSRFGPLSFFLNWGTMWSAKKTQRKLYCAGGTQHRLVVLRDSPLCQLIVLLFRLFCLCIFILYKKNSHQSPGNKQRHLSPGGLKLSALSNSSTCIPSASASLRTFWLGSVRSCLNNHGIANYRRR